MTLAVLLGTGLASVGGATAPTGCDQTAPREEKLAGLSLELQPGRYLFLPQDMQDPSALEKMGFWEESNRRGGLQTDTCWKYGGLYRVYFADTHEGLAVP